MIEPGMILNERYKLTKTLGEGGMANVYLAHDLILDRDVAVKVLRLDLQGDPDTVRRFQREAMATTELVHPNIVSIYDVGESHGQQYLVMEYVHGSDLKKYIVKNFPIPYQRIVDIMTEILSAVQLAHDHHIIHRDLKPQNIMIDEAGQAKITDFGIAVALSENSMTMTNSLLGSVHYLSPEQARGSMPTRQSDIYALGIILYEMLTGSVPFEGDSAVSVALKHFQEEMPSARDFDSRIPQALENVIIKATAKDPAERYTSAEAMASDLETVLSPARAHEARYVVPAPDLDETKIIPVIDQEAAQTTPEQTTTPTTASKKSRFKRLWPFILAGVVGVILLIGIGVALAGGRGDVSVPDVRNMTLNQAKLALGARNLKLGKVTKAHSSTVKQDRVIRSDPAQKVSVKAESKVDLVVSEGQKQVTIGNYVGKLYEDIRADLQKAGFKVKRVDRTDDEATAGQILEQDPTPGKKVVAKGTTITLTVAEGSKSFALRDLSDYTEKAARDYATEMGLILQVRYTTSNTKDNGVVLHQSPAAGMQVTAGTTVFVTISRNNDASSSSSSSSSSAPEQTHTVTKTIQIPYLAETASESSSSSSSSAAKPNAIQIFIGDKSHDIADVYRTFNISSDDEITLTLVVSAQSPGSYRITRDGQVIAQEGNITQ